uniref:Putative secreted protein n=1 Tax=Anopheles darlingi TaxID=43151 RepID=A0A2M4DB74_ANODA
MIVRRWLLIRSLIHGWMSFDEKLKLPPPVEASSTRNTHSQRGSSIRSFFIVRPSVRHATHSDGLMGC